ncbi:MAG: response regulator transcription factor [Desulfitobacterium sp.]|nr:response regulator transcription factor [Desulfitobacterium sp.]
MIIGVVEDELLFRNELVSFLYTIPDIERIFVFANGEELLNSVHGLKFDVLFLDIGLPGISGIEVAKRIRRDCQLVDIIFITADDSYIKDAFRLYASDYIEKTLNVERLKITIERISWRFKSSIKKIELKMEEGVLLLNQNEIYWVEAMSKKSVIYTKDNTYTCLHSLKEVEKRLDKGLFYRTSRSDLVNLRFVESIQPSTRNLFRIIFKGKEYQAFLQKSKYQEFRKRIKNLSLV